MNKIDYIRRTVIELAKSKNYEGDAGILNAYRTHQRNLGLCDNESISHDIFLVEEITSDLNSEGSR